MNYNKLNYHDIYLDNYYSPFPREKSNREALKYSYAKKLKNNKTIIDIPPSVTLSYMSKNPLYFDIKKHKNLLSKPCCRPKSSNPKISKVPTYNKYNKNNYCCCTIYDNKKLEQILSSTKDKFIAPRNTLNKGCELVQGLIYKPMNPRPVLTPDEALKIINKINFPSPPQNKNVPEYINEFKIRTMIEKEYERLVEEEKGYPPGTFKIWEEDRVIILTNLFLIREELLEKLRHFPVDYYLRSYGIKNRRRETEKRLDEIDYAIKIFQLTDVYLKV
jgi:hypothetical protein